MPSTKKKRRRQRANNRRFDPARTASNELEQTVDEAIAAAAKHQLAGRYTLAAGLYAHVLSVAPQHPDAWHLAGVLAYQQGDHPKALEFIRHAIELAPDRAHFYINLSNVYCALRQPQKAIEACRIALRMTPESPLAWSNLGNAHRDLGDLDQATKFYRIATEHDPKFYDAHINLGTVLLHQNRTKKAEQSFRAALAIAPERLEGRSNLGLVLGRKGDFAEALETFTAALVDFPGQTSLIRNFRNGLYNVGSLDAARASYGRILSNENPALQEFLTASISPLIPSSLAEIESYRPQLASILRDLKGARMLDNHQALATLQVTSPFYLPYQARNDLELKKAFAAACTTPRLDALRCQQLDARESRHPGKLRVGFPIGFDRQRIFTRFLKGMCDYLLSTDEFDLVVACPSGSIPELQGKLDPQIHLVPLVPDLAASAKTLAEQKCDVLFYLEVGTDSLTQFLPFFSAAPIQVASWGTPVTSGIPTMDYYLSSELLEPLEAQDHYSETLYKLRTLPAIYSKPMVAPLKKTREDFGFSDSDQLIGCLQNPFKIHPDFDQALAEILRRNDFAKVALTLGTYPNAEHLLRARFKRTIADVEDRITFMPRLQTNDFNDFNRLCDVVLDTFHFGGGATAYECLSMGIPVVTLPGEFMRGRATAACYKKMGFTETIAEDPKDFVNKVLALATNPDQRAVWSDEIRGRSDCLFADRTAGQEFAEFLQHVYAAPVRDAGEV